MPRIQLPIADGFYETDSLPVSSQNCVNLLPILEDADALVMETLREAPGVTLVFPAPNVPLFDPLDTDADADPEGPTPPDPGAVPLIPDAPKPDLDEDSGATDPGAPVPIPPGFLPECLPYACDALEATYPADGRFLYTSTTPDLSGWLPWDSGQITFTHRGEDPFDNQPDGTDTPVTLIDIGGTARPLTELGVNSPATFDGEIPDFCLQESHIFDHQGGAVFNDGIVHAFNQTSTTLALSAIIGPGHREDVGYRGIVNRGTRIMHFKGRMTSEWLRPSSGQTSSPDFDAQCYISFGTDGNEIVVRFYSEVLSLVRFNELGRFTVDDGFYNKEFHFVRAEMNFGSNIEVDLDADGRFLSGIGVNVIVEIRWYSDVSGTWQTESFNQVCEFVNPGLYYDTGQAPLDGSIEHVQYATYNPDRISILGSGSYSIAMARTHIVAQFPDMDSLQLAWERNKVTYTPPGYC